MKITVINGTEKHGVTYNLKERFLQSFESAAEITEYYLPKDCPSFCLGCTSCFMNGENTCKDYRYISAIEKSLLEADLIVMTSPAYVMHATGAMKALKTYKCALMNDIVWNKLSEKKRKKMLSGISKLADKLLKIDYSKPARTKAITKIKFRICRMIQKKVRKSGGGLDCEYWQSNGWLGKAKPWERA